MDFLSTEPITFKPDDNIPGPLEQVSDCIDKVHAHFKETRLAESSIYKVLIFLNKESLESSGIPLRKIIRQLEDSLHGEIVLTPLFLAPVDCNMMLEVYYNSLPGWINSYRKHESGAVSVFTNDKLKIASGFAASDSGDCEKDAVVALRALEQQLKDNGLGIPDLIRQWNYIENILHKKNGHQNYQVFNDVRTSFYSDHFKKNGFPAATGIGTQGGGITIEFTAIKGDNIVNLAIDNPGQVPAHKYNEKYLQGLSKVSIKTTPKFERARYLSQAGMDIVLVSGTSAITGEETMHPTEIGQQMKLSIDNIEKLTSKSNLNRYQPGIPKLSFNYLRVYLKSPEHYQLVKKICRERFGNIAVSWLRADVCREGLNVEIEATLRAQNT